MQTCPARGRVGPGTFGSLNGGSALAVGVHQRDHVDRWLLLLDTRGLVEICEKGHDDGLNSRVEAAVLTRCLSPLGTGNDETGSAGLNGFGVCWSVQPLVAHCALLGGNRYVVSTSTALTAEINIPMENTTCPLSSP